MAWKNIKESIPNPILNWLYIKKMNEIYPIAKLGDEILIINKEDLEFVGKEKALEVKCVKVDLDGGIIVELLELEDYLKFSPWEEVEEEERESILNKITDKFPESELTEKIVKKLAENRVEPEGSLGRPR